MAEETPDIPAIRPESLARRQSRTDVEPDMVQFGHVMSKKLADQLDERCKDIGGLSRRALMNVILWEAMNGQRVTLVDKENPGE